MLRFKIPKEILLHSEQNLKAKQILRFSFSPDILRNINPQSVPVNNQSKFSIRGLCSVLKTFNSPLITPKKAKKEIKFPGKAKRSISLAEKNKMGSNIFKEELKLKVTINSVVDETCGLPTKKYKIISKIGDGGYGIVFLAENVITKAKVAMKIINKKQNNIINDNEIKNEINILKKLSHPNILKIIEFYSTDKSYYIITDYYSYGELFDQVKNEFTENQLAVLFYQIFSALCYLHQNKIIHRDLKLENIILSDIEIDKITGNCFYWIKIIDFGNAKMLIKNQNEKTIIGSSYYIAPEVLNCNYNEKCDTWSAGVILYMLIVGNAPFDGETDEEIMEQVKTGQYDKKNKKLISSSIEVQDLLSKLLEVNVSKRLSAMDALAHPWFTKFKGKSLYMNITVSKVKEIIQRLLKFEINSKFQQMVLAFIVHNLQVTEETKDILRVFRMFNIKDDGKLTKGQLYMGLVQYIERDVVNKVIEDLCILLDGANKGYIEYEEFLGACMDKNTVLSEQNLVYAFRFFDKNNTGRISVDKIKRHFVDNTINEEVFRSIFDEIETKGKGEIDFSEFKDIMFGNI